MTNALAVQQGGITPDLLQRSRNLLAEAQTLDEVLRIRTIASFAHNYYRAAVHSRKVAQQAAELRLRAERKAGEMLRETRENGTRARSGKESQTVTLSDLDITRMQSSRWQAVAAVPDAVFEEYIEEHSQSSLDELTTTGLMTAAKYHRRDEQAEEIRQSPPAMPEGPFSVIVADPPWPYALRRPSNDSRGTPAYHVMPMEEIEGLSVTAIAADDCILWLWTTNAFLREAFACLDAWGFQYRTMLTWGKNRIGLGDWLRGQTEHCLLATRGRPLVTLKNQGTLLLADVREHSRKPEEFYSLVENLCPTPEYGKVELFSRTGRPGWRTWGQEAERDEQ